MSDAEQWDLKRAEAVAEQDEIDLELRSPVEIRTRILLLASLFRRLSREDRTDGDGSDATAEAFDEREWLREHDLSGRLTADEAALLDSPPGSVAREAISEASWQGEAFVALGWAIGAYDMPPVGTVSDPRPLLDVVPRPWDDTKEWLGDPAIIAESQAAREREIAEIWYWRLTTEVLRRTASAADRQDYEEAIRDVAAEALAAGFLPALRDGDFSMDGSSIKDLSGDDIDVLIAVTGQRLRALNWLCGFGKSWDEIPLDI
jgi:hypothetical protein